MRSKRMGIRIKGKGRHLEGGMCHISDFGHHSLERASLLIHRAETILPGEHGSLAVFAQLRQTTGGDPEADDSPIPMDALTPVPGIQEQNSDLPAPAAGPPPLPATPPAVLEVRGL